MNDAITPYPSRLVLEGVPRAGTDIHRCPFPGSLYAILEYLGDRHPYEYLLGTSGAAFRQLFELNDGGNIDLSKLGEAPFRLAFEATGYAWHAVPPEKELMLAAIKESLKRGVPAISFGIGGPPEAGIIAGYDRDGEVLYGWNYLAPPAAEYFELGNWYETMSKIDKGLIVIEGKQATAPSPLQVLATSLQWAIDLECTPARPNLLDHASGLAAYDAWAKALEDDGNYPPEDWQVLGGRMMSYSDQCTMVEERLDTARFLRLMKAVLPDAVDPQVAGSLEAAAALYDEVYQLVFKLWPWPEFEMPTLEMVMDLAKPETRRRIAGFVRDIREKEAQAAEYMKKALEAIRRTA